MWLFTNLSPGYVKEIYLSLIIYCSCMCNGICRSFPAYLITQIQSTKKLPMTIEEASWIASIPVFLIPPGCIFGGLLFDIKGRKFGLLSGYVPCFIGWIVIACANNVNMLYVGMALNGFGNGILNGGATHVAEICSAESRSSLLMLLQTNFAVGVILSSAVCYLLGWRLAAICFVVLIVVAFISAFSIVPESPSWMIGHGRQNEAIQTLRWLRDTELAVQRDIADIENYYSTLASEKRSGFELFNKIVSSWRQFLIVITLFELEQGSACLLLTSYTVTLFSELQIPIDPNIASLGYSIIAVISAIAIPFVFQKMGRRSILKISSVICLVSMIGIIGYEMTFLTLADKPCFWIVLVSMYAYVMFNNLSIAIIPTSTAGEIFPAEVRGVMNGLSLAIGYFSGAVVMKIFPWYLYTFGIVSCLWVFAGHCLAIVLFAQFIMPETKGKTLTEIQEQYFPT